MTAAKIKTYIYFAGYFIFGLAIIILQSSGIMTLNISTASALLILPATVFAGVFFKEFSGAIFGLVSGVIIDVYSSTYCYNAVALTICGFLSGILVSRLFNNNLISAIVLDFSASFAYFFFKWLVLYAFVDDAAVYILLRYTIPSAIYTAAVGVLMYLILSVVFKRIPVIRRH